MKCTFSNALKLRSSVLIFHYCCLAQVTFENIGSFFASLEPGPGLDTLDKLFTGILKGMRASTVNVPGSAYHHALQVIYNSPYSPPFQNKRRFEIIFFLTY